MDISDVINGLQQLVTKFSGHQDAKAQWALDEAIFADHFGASYEEFCLKLALLNVDQQIRYERTLEVNPEAAILWILCMGPVPDTEIPIEG